jgi:hypothetical protein
VTQVDFTDFSALSIAGFKIALIFATPKMDWGA